MNQDIRKKLDRITDTLWAGGVSNPVTYIEQLSYLIYLKMLDERESRSELEARMLGESSKTKSLFPNQAERFRWSKWRFYSGTKLRDFVRNEVFPYMGNLVKEEPQIAEYFRDAVLEIADPNVLKEVVDEIDAIDFSKLGTDVKGDIFEYLLTHLGSAALNGQFRTPRQIRTMMVEMLDPDLGDTVNDPACGTAGFLIDYTEYVLAKYSEEPREVPIYGDEWLEARGQTIEEAKAQLPTLQIYRKGAGELIPDWGVLENSIYGTDVSRTMVRISMMNLVLHSVRATGVKRANALSELGGLTEDDLNRKYKVILSNPPFAGILPKDSIRKDLPTQSKKSELLFLGVIMRSLAPGGRCAVVVPEGLLFGSTSAHVELRRKLVEDFELQAVVSLPAGVFKPYAGVKTGVLIFRRPLEQRQRKAGAKRLDVVAISVDSGNMTPMHSNDYEPHTKVIWFYEVRNDGYDPDKIAGGGRPETPERNDIPDLLKQWKEYKASGFKSVPGIKANTLLDPGSKQPRSWWADIETIAANDYNLAAGRYKGQVADDVLDDDPVELINEVLVIERQISSELEDLLQDVESTI